MAGTIGLYPLNAPDTDDHPDVEIWSRLEPHGEFFTVVYPDGQVRSVQPQGHIEKRPAGTAGAYELCAVSGNVAVYNPGAIWEFTLTTGGVPNL